MKYLKWVVVVTVLASVGHALYEWRRDSKALDIVRANLVAELQAHEKHAVGGAGFCL